MKKCKGYLHSIETMGLVDGPGIRVVVFMQGCILRCSFCHNPDTWQKTSKFIMTPNELVDEIRKYRPYIEGEGGVTFSGGEPLFQSEFLLETLKLCKKAGINTCLDTSGTGYTKKYLDDIIKYSDIILLDVKAIDPKGYKKITTRNITMFDYFVSRLNLQNKRVWIRQVVLLGINDTEEYMLALKEYCKKINGVEKIELLPYHTMAVKKYRKLRLYYRLKNLKDMDVDTCKKLEDIVKL